GGGGGGGGEGEEGGTWGEGRWGGAGTGAARRRRATEDRARRGSAGRRPASTGCAARPSGPPSSPRCRRSSTRRADHAATAAGARQDRPRALRGPADPWTARRGR